MNDQLPEELHPLAVSTPNVSCYLLQQHGRSLLREVFTVQGGVVEEGGMGGGTQCQLFQSHVIYILFPFQEPQNDQYSASKRCRLATLKRPAYEPASGEPSIKRSAPYEELEYTIMWSLTDEEEGLNLVSPLLTSKVTMSALIIAWH